MRSSEKRVRRLRLLITILLAAGALAAAAATLKERLHLQVGVFLTFVLTVLAVIAPLAQGWLKQAQALLDKQDQKEEDRAKQLGDRARKDVLEQVRRAWVETELQGSLHEQARIELGLAERPVAVDNPLRAILRRPDQPDHLLEPGQPIAEVYRQLGKQLLILGEPGAGKTTLLLELTQQLVEDAEAAPDQPMPVVFHLSSWALERRALAAWLVDELYKLYGVPRRLGQIWVDTNQLIPLLDGLDEVATEHRDACLAAINAFHDDHGQLPLVACSRITEYEALRANLRLRGAIVIQPLSRVEVDRYLRQAGRPLAGVRAALREDKQLRELLTTPLFLSIVALTYKTRSAVAVRASGTLDERRQQVLADYIEAMLNRSQPSARPSHYSRQQTVSWLTWLAGTMRAHGQSVFYLDWMQPDWLPRQTQRRLVTTGTAAGTGLSCALILVLILALVGVLNLGPDLGPGLVFGLAVVLLGGLGVGLSAYDAKIAPTQQLRWSKAALRRKFPRWLVRGALGGWLVFALFGAALSFNAPSFNFVAAVIGTIIAPILGVPAGLVFGLLVGLATKSRRNALVSGLIVCLIAGELFASMLGWSEMVTESLAGGLAVGLLFGLVSGLEHQDYVTPPAPTKATQTSRRNALVSGLIVFLAAGLPFGLLPQLTYSLMQLGTELRFGLLDQLTLLWWPLGQLLQGLLGPIFGLAMGLILGSIVGLQRGGGAYLRHHVLRWLLIHNGFTPKDYPAFLDYATRLILLRRRGGGYEFVHRLLLEHFAALEPHSWQAKVSQGVGRLANDDSDSGSATPVRGAQAPPHPRDPR